MPPEGATLEAPPDLGSFAQFVGGTDPGIEPTPIPGAATAPPGPTPGPDLGSFEQFVNPGPSTEDLGSFAQFVSPTPHAYNAAAQTNAVADQVIAQPFRIQSAAQIEAEDVATVRAQGPMLNIPQAEIKPEDPIGIKANKAIYNTASGFVSGSTSVDGLNMLLNPVFGIGALGKGAVDLVKRYQEVAKTPPYSPERVQFASDAGAFMALPLVVHTIGKVVAATRATTREGGEIQYAKQDTQAAQPDGLRPGPEVPGQVKEPTAPQGGEGVPLGGQGPPLGEGAAAEALSPSQLVPALRTESGQIIPGTKGQIHDNIYETQPDPVALRASDPEHGFVNPEQPENFYPRARAGEAIGKPGELQSEDLVKYQAEEASSRPPAEPVTEAPPPEPSIAAEAAAKPLSAEGGAAPPSELQSKLAAIPEKERRQIADKILKYNRDRAKLHQGHSGKVWHGLEVRQDTLERKLAGHGIKPMIKGVGEMDEAWTSLMREAALREQGITEAPAPASGGPGAASQEEFMQRYASIGASHILRGTIDDRAFGQAMEQSVGHTGIRDILPEIRIRSEQLINEMQTATGKTDVSREINRQVGVTKLVEQPERVRLFGALKDSLAAAERAGVAGFKRGYGEATAEGKVQLKEAEAAGRAKAKEATAAGERKLREARAKARTVDDWLAADQADVARMLTDYAKNLPMRERGKFTSAINNATRRVPLGTKDPAVIYRRAETVLNKITEAIYNANKRQAILDIRARLKKIEDSPSIAVGEKQIARQFANTFNNLKNNMSFDMLEAMHRSILEIEQTGKDMLTLSKTMRELRTKLSLKEIQDQTTTLKLDNPTPVQLKIGDERGRLGKTLDKLADMPAHWRHTNLAWTPMDYIFQIFDGKPNGALYRTMKLPFDMKYSLYLQAKNAYFNRLRPIVQKYGLTEGKLNRITAFAELQQEGGLENLMSRGFTEKELKDIRLSPGERAYMDEGRAIHKELFPKLQQMLKDNFNQEIKAEPFYWPRQRDWDFYNSFSILEGKYSKGFRRVSPEKGHAIERITGAVTQNVLNAHEIMFKSIDDHLYQTIMAPELRNLSDIIKSDAFKNEVGTWGQQVFVDWLDTLARNGGIEAGRRNVWVDWARKNAGVAQLAFRLTTTGLQFTSLLDGMGMVSSKSMGRAISRMASKETRQWILDSMPEVKDRIGDDPALRDYGGHGFGDTLAKAGYHFISKFDRFSAMTIADAAYRDALIKRKLDPNLYNGPGKPLHMDAMHEAQAIVRKTQSSAQAKDLPSALARGGWSGSASLDKAIGQFQNFMIGRWARMKHDGFQVGIKEKNPRAGARVLSFILLATIAEQLGREGIDALFRTVFGESDAAKKRREKDPGFGNRVMKHAKFDLMTSVPVLSNVVGAIKYEGTGIPLVDLGLKGIKGAKQMLTGKKPATRAKGAIRAAQTVIGTTTPIPTGQAGDLLIRWIDAEEAARKTHKLKALPKPKRQPGQVESGIVKSR